MMGSSGEGWTAHGGMRRSEFLKRMGGGAALAAMPGLLAACGSGTQGSGGDGESLRLVGVADQKPPVEEMLKRYRERNPDVTFRTSFAPTDQVMTSVRAQLGAGNAPDVHVVYPGNGSAMSMVQVSEAGLLTDLSDQPWVDMIPDSFRPAFEKDGKVYLFSVGSTVIGAIYNKDVFEQAGVEPPATWSELLQVCQKIKKAGKVPIALGNQTPWITQLIDYALVPSTVFAGNPDFAEQHLAGKTSFSESGWRDAMEMYLELQKRGFFNDNPNGTTFEQQTAMVATGEAAMAVQVSAVLPAFKDAAKDPDVLAMFPFPGADDPEKIWIAAGVVVGFGVSASAKDPEAAKAFLAFMGEEENLVKYSEIIGAIPMAPGAGVDPVVEPFVPYIEQNRSVPFMDQQWPNAEIQPVHFSVVQRLLGGEINVDRALREMDEAYQKS
jgi:raffinose/stachyose/melibiose transport system substrate-binding protein